MGMGDIATLLERAEEKLDKSKTGQFAAKALSGDGFSLDDKRTPLYDSTFAGDLPDCLTRWRGRDPQKDTDRTVKGFFVTAQEIREKDYDLSLNRFKETVYEEVQYVPPKEILKKLKGLECEIMQHLVELEGMLG